MGAEQSRVEDDLQRNNGHGEKGDPIMLRDIARMDQAIRSKVRTGVQYNMKIILRGERGTGKTSLWRRFQGQTFSDKYVATPEIQSATINWSYRNGEDNVKVDVWDVVDKAIKPKSLPKFDGGQQGRHKVDSLDASIIDVYQDASAVVFLINPNSISSLTYVRNMAREVPLHITILVLFNFRDLLEDGNGQTTALQFEQVESLCNDIRSYRRDRFKAEKHLHQSANGNSLRSIYVDNSGKDENNTTEETLLENNVFCFQTSLLNCFGLLEVNQFLDIPFLGLKQQSLKKQLLQAQNDLLDATHQLQLSATQLRHAQHYTHFASRHNSIKTDHNQRVPGESVATQHETVMTQEETEENDRSHKLTQSLHQRRQFEQEQLQQMQLKQQQQQQQPQFSLKLDHFSDKNDHNIPLNDEVIEQNIKKSKNKKDFKSSKHNKNHSKNNNNTNFSDNQSSTNNKSNKIDSPPINGHRDMFNDFDSDSGDNNHPFFEGKGKKGVSLTQNKKTKQNVENSENNNDNDVNNSQHFDQEVASFTPMGQDLENFLQISDDEERFMRQQKDKIRQYVKPLKSSKDTRNTNNNKNRNHFNDDDDDDDDDNDFGDRFLAKKTVSSSSRLQPARRLRPSADL